MSTQRSPEAVARLAALVRELAAREDFKILMHYSHLIATLQDLHDELAELEKGSGAHYAKYAEATRIFKAARTYASEHSLEHPNKLLQDCGYNPFA